MTLLSSTGMKRRLPVCCSAALSRRARLRSRDVGLDIAGLVPVAHLDLVFLGIEIFFLAGNRLVLQQFEAVVDAVGARQRGGQRRARLEHPGLAALQMIGQDIGRIDEEIRAIVIALRIAGQFVQILLQLPLLGSPGEVGVGLGEAELGEALHQLRPRKGFGEEDHVGMRAAGPRGSAIPRTGTAWCAGLSTRKMLTP